MPGLHISVFGHLEITLDGVPISGFDSNKVRALLVYLAVESNRAHAREALASMFWPDFPHKTALSNLRYALSNLRKTMGDQHASSPLLLVDNRSIKINPETDYFLDCRDFEVLIDSGDIEQIRKAAELFRSDFLEGFSIPDSIGFENWLVRTRERFHHLAQNVLLSLCDHHERLGDYSTAQRYALRLLELEPWLEPAHLRLMRLFASVDQRSSALAQFETCQRILQEELGAQPGQETVDLYEQIRDGKFIKPPPPPRFLLPDTGDQARTQPAFLGREAEMARLNTIWNDVMKRQGQAIFVVGEAGSGKTMLINKFSQQLQDHHPDVLVVHGKCNAQSGVGDPYLPFLECMRMLSGDVEGLWAGGLIQRAHALRLWKNLGRFIEQLLQEGPALIDRFVPGKQLLERARVGAPQWVEDLEKALENAEASQPNLQQDDLFEQHTRVLQNLAVETPVVLILDDLQWADLNSTGLLFHLGRRLSGHRILVLGASRPQGLNLSEQGSIGVVLNEFRRQDGEIFIDLAHADGIQFVQALVDAEPNRLDDNFRTELYRHTLGNPLYATELLNSLRSRGEIVQGKESAWEVQGELDWSALPDRVEAAISESVRQVPEPLIQLVTTASVEGERFTAQVLAAEHGLPVEEVIRFLSGPLSRDYSLVTSEGIEIVNDNRIEYYRFRHILFQNFFIGLLDPVECARLHGRIGKTLEQLYGLEEPERALQLAYHFEQAQMFEKAIHYFSQAAEHAVRLLAHQQAITHYEKALSLLEKLPKTTERDRRELKLRTALGGPLLAVYGFGHESLANNYKKALELSPYIENPTEKFMALVGLHAYYDVRLELQTSFNIAVGLLEIAEETEDPWQQMMAYHDHACTASYLGDIKTFLSGRKNAHQIYHQYQFGGIVYETAFDPEVAGLAHESWALYHLGFSEQAEKKAKESIALSESLGHPFMRAFAYNFTAQLYCMLQNRLKARTYAEKATELADKDIGFWGINGQFLAIWGKAEQGLADKELKMARELFETLRAMGAEMGYASNLAPLAELYAIMGREKEGLALLEDGMAVVNRASFKQIQAWLHTCKGDLLKGLGDKIGAEKSYQQALDVAKQLGALGDQLRPATKLARQMFERGEQNNAYVLLSAVYSQFTEGFKTPSMVNARNLLDLISDSHTLISDH
jgi:DNA-binding SARP family transcriptional activator